MPNTPKMPLSHRRIDDLVPTHRSQCGHGLRPCPWIRCRFHKIWHTPKIFQESDERVVDFICSMDSSCLLDGATLEEVGRFYGITRERVRQLEDKELRAIKNKARYGGEQNKPHRALKKMWGEDSG